MTFLFAFVGPIPFLIIGMIPCGRMQTICEIAVLLLPFLFPFALLSFIPIPFHESYIPFVFLAVIQFPVYATIWYQVRKRTKFRGTAWIIVGVHLVMAFVAFMVWANAAGK